MKWKSNDMYKTLKKSIVLQLLIIINNSNSRKINYMSVFFMKLITHMNKMLRYMYFLTYICFLYDFFI